PAPCPSGAPRSPDPCCRPPGGDDSISGSACPFHTILSNGLLTGKPDIPGQSHIRVARGYLHRVTPPPRLLRRDDRGTGPTERLANDVVRTRGCFDQLLGEGNRERCGVPRIFIR